ncbi:MAG: hypothetical protein ACYC61_25195 [Isosphaeraceae bacterium]
MLRFPQAVASVIACALVGGLAGGLAGAIVGRLAPSFVLWIRSLPGTEIVGFDPTGFGLGLGAVCGLLMGAAAGVVLVSILSLRDAYLARYGVADGKPAADRLLLD